MTQRLQTSSTVPVTELMVRFVVQGSGFRSYRVEGPLRKPVKLSRTAQGPAQQKWVPEFETRDQRLKASALR